MMPEKPEPLEVEVIEAKIKIIKDDEEDGRIRVECLKSSTRCSGWIWCGMLVKNLFRDKQWHKILKNQKTIYFALHGGWNTTVSVDIWYGGKWNRIWNASNNFDSLAEDKRSIKAYNDFANNEAKKVSRMVDEGRSYKYIKSKMSKQHSGNTWAWAFAIGFRRARSKKKAKIIQSEYNKEHGGSGKEDGTINPAVLTIGEKE